MTNAMPIFINSLIPFLTGESLDAQAKQLIEAARSSVALAEKEIKYGDIAFMQSDKDSETPNIKIADISIWHYSQGLKNYSEAINGLNQASKLNPPSKYKKYIDLKTKKCLEEMAYANSQKIALKALF